MIATSAPTVRQLPTRSSLCMTSPARVLHRRPSSNSPATSWPPNPPLRSRDRHHEASQERGISKEARRGMAASIGASFWVAHFTAASFFVLGFCFCCFLPVLVARSLTPGPAPVPPHLMPINCLQPSENTDPTITKRTPITVFLPSLPPTR